MPVEVSAGFGNQKISSDWVLTPARNDFRPAFGNLDSLRYHLPGVPFGACTATCPPEKMLRLRASLGIPKKAIGIIEGVDRPNLFYGVRPIQGTGMTGEKDLDFLIPPQAYNPETANPVPYDYSKIPLTIVYVNSKLVGHAVAEQLRMLLPNKSNRVPKLDYLPQWDWDGRSQAQKVVAVYHASLSPSMKAYIQAHWRDGTTRILVATSAWGMGINDRKVERVIQWRVKDLDNLDSLYQRFGRCARSPEIQGLCLLFTEKDYMGPRTDPDCTPASSKNKMRNKLEKGLYCFINCPSTKKCRRKTLLGFYADKEYHSNSPQICCDLCDSNGVAVARLAPGMFCSAFQFQIPLRVASQFPRPSSTLRDSVRNVLKPLRLEILNRDYKHKLRSLTPLHILNDEQVESLAAHCRGIQSADTILQIPGFTINSSHFRKHG